MTGQIGEVEANAQDTILDLKVCAIHSRSTVLSCTVPYCLHCSFLYTNVTHN